MNKKMLIITMLLSGVVLLNAAQGGHDGPNHNNDFQGQIVQNLIQALSKAKEKTPVKSVDRQRMVGNGGTAKKSLFGPDQG
jgi:hypothetical protein